MELKKLTINFDSELELELFKKKMTKGEVAIQNMINFTEHFINNKRMKRDDFWIIMRKSLNEVIEEFAKGEKHDE